MQPQSTQNMYVTTNANGNGGNIRPNQQTVYRGPPAASPTQRNSTRQLSMQNLCPQALHPNFALSNYAPYTPRQSAYQNPQQYSFSHSTIPHQSFYYQNQLFMQTQPTHRGTIVQAAANVPIPGPSGIAPASLPPAVPTLISTQQVQANPLLVPGGISTHTPQPSKQRKSHPNRLEIIDPDTKKNILDEYELVKAQSQVPPVMHTSLNTEYSLTGSSVTPPDSNISASLIVVQDSRHNIPYNMTLIADPHSVPSQRDVIQHTPIVSAMADAPSIEIPSSSSKCRSKKISIVSPKEDTDGKNAFGADDNSNQVIMNAQKEDCVVLNFVPDKNPENIDESTSNIQQDSSNQFEIIVEGHTESPPIVIENNLNDHESLSEKSDQLDQVNNQLNENLTASDAIKPYITELDSETCMENTIAIEVEDIHDNGSTLEETPSFKPNKDGPHIQNVPYSEDQNDATATTLENPADTVQDENLNLGSLSNDGETIKESKDETDKVSLEKPHKNQSDLADDNKIVKEDQEKTENSRCNAEATKTQHILQCLINYKDWQWSPTNPSGKKKYNREQLMQLRDGKASQVQLAIKDSSILSQFNLLPTFIPKNHKRVQSMVGIMGSNRVADGNNYSGKQNSMTATHNRNSCKGEKIKLNLSLNQDVKLNETDNAWRPRILQKNNENDEADPESKLREEKEDLIRKVRGILNKLTPEKFEILVEEIFKLKIDTDDKKQDVLVLVFEKAVDEPNFSEFYASLCHRLITVDTTKNDRLEQRMQSTTSFKTALLDKTEQEFTQNVSSSSAKELKLKPINEKIKKCSDQNEKAELEIQLEEEERKIRRRSVGTVRFIGELFKLDLLTAKIINDCITRLSKGYNEDSLECLCKLLTTVGSKFEGSLKNPKHDKYTLDNVIARIQAIANKTDKNSAKISSRVRFMLQDVIDLRKKNWQMTRIEAPKTMEQIEKDAKNAQLSSHYLGSVGATSHSGMGTFLGSANKRDERPNRFGESRYSGSHSQRGDSGYIRRQQGGSGSFANNNYTNGTKDENGWHVQTSKGSRSTSFDSNKLDFINNVETKYLGNFKHYQWNNESSARPPTAPSNFYAELSYLTDNKNSELDRERDRDRNVPRNKGSFHKNSMERERIGITARSLTNQNVREHSSSRNTGAVRMSSSAGAQKTSNQSKYIPQSSRISSKAQTTQNSEIESIDSSLKTSDLPKSNVVQNINSEVIFKMLTEEEINGIKIVITDMLDSISYSTLNFSTITNIFDEVKPNQYCGFLYYLLTDYLHLAKVGQMQRRYLSTIITHLVEIKVLSLEHFAVAYKQFCCIVSDLMVDIPELWLYIFEFTGILLTRKCITIHDLWTNDLIRENEAYIGLLGNKFLKTFLNYCIREIGPNFTKCMWKKYNMQWTDFLEEPTVNEFIMKNNFEFIENGSKHHKVVIYNNETNEVMCKRIGDRIDVMLKEGAKSESIIDYINGNIVEIDRVFIKCLTTILCDFAIVSENGNYKLDMDRFRKICIPILQRYIDSKEDFELECLVAIQALVNNLEHPRAVLSDLFSELYNSDVMPQDAFIKWRDSKDQSAGKGVAVKGLNQFFAFLISESSDENV